jgi:O-antigen/teichoic acid export membrane protein
VRLTIAVGYLTQLYITVIGIILMPIYLRYLGAEGFGLVGFYIMLQGWMPIFDIGLTPVLSREMSRFRAGALTAGEAAIRLRTLEVILGVLATLVVTALWVGSGWVGRNWLSAVTLPGDAIAQSIVLMGVAVALRWFAGLQRAVLIGLEYQGLVNGLTAGFATLRFVGALPLLLYVSTLPEHFFAFQVAVGALELTVFMMTAHFHVPGGVGIRPDSKVLVNMLPMVGSMAFLTTIWVILTQVDKLILSGLLSLKDFGYFTLAAMAASGVLVLVGPLNQVIQPRLTILVEKGEEDKLVELYRLSSQFVVVGFMSMGGGLAFFAEPILLIWSGNPVVAAATAPILFWYGLANVVVGILVLPFMLQFARGRLRLHVLANLILLATLAPALAFAAKHWGAVGAGQVFFVANLLFLLLWVPIIHRYFLPILTWRWSFRDTLPAALVMLIVLEVGSKALPNEMQMLETLGWIGAVVFVAAMLGMAMGDLLRPLALRWVFGARA